MDWAHCFPRIEGKANGRSGAIWCSYEAAGHRLGNEGATMKAVLIAAFAAGTMTTPAIALQEPARKPTASAATTLIGTPQEQAQIEPFGVSVREGGKPRREACSAVRHWCAELLQQGQGGAWRLNVGDRHLLLPFQETDGMGGSDMSLWPHIITSPAGSILIGVEGSRRSVYSGGGASVTTLTLVELPADGGALRPVAELPLLGRAMIRACFDKRDTRRRRGACNDEYGFEGTVQLGESHAGGLPDLLLTTKAETSPGRRSRFNETDRPVRRGDPLTWRDPVCSYRRTFTYDRSTARYQPDRPLPACRDYLDRE